MVSAGSEAHPRFPITILRWTAGRMVGTWAAFPTASSKSRACGELGSETTPTSPKCPSPDLVCVSCRAEAAQSRLILVPTQVSTRTHIGAATVTDQLCKRVHTYLGTQVYSHVEAIVHDTFNAAASNQWMFRGGTAATEGVCGTE